MSARKESLMRKREVRERERETETDSPRSPAMDRDVPILPESSNVLSIPPVTVELSVCEAEKLGSEIHHCMKRPVETKQPKEMVGQLHSVNSHMTTSVLVAYRYGKLRNFRCKFIFVVDGGYGNQFYENACAL